MTRTLKIRENRVRRAAVGQGLAVAKSRRRSTDVADSGSYMIFDPQTDAVVLAGDSGDYGLTIEQVEEFLSDPSRAKSFAVENLNAANDK